jgi:hypothetical protein
MLDMSTIEERDVAALYSSGSFDPVYYSSTYPDVRESGLDPALHFLWLGAKLGRLPEPPKHALWDSLDGVLDVLFVDGTNGTSSTPYRVDRVAAGLIKLGASVRCVRGEEVHNLAKEDLRARYVTFFRTPFVDPYRSFARRMRASGSRIVFDVDDLIFEEEQIPIIDGYRYLAEHEKIGYRRGVRAYREFVLFADFCTAPTEFLADRMRLLGKKAYRVRNSIDDAEIERFRISRPGVRQSDFVVGYYSGSKTHQVDFRNAGEALVRFMAEESSACFRLVGEFDLTEYPALLKLAGQRACSRVTKIGLMDHSEMLEDQLRCDIIIAPLEVGNPFCEAKSELKFFEAALVERPVIASPTQTFQAATLDGQLAQLADLPGQWLDAFRTGLRESHRLREVAARAHEYVVDNYSPGAAGQDAVLAYSEVLAA